MRKHSLFTLMAWFVLVAGGTGCIGLPPVASPTVVAPTATATAIQATPVPSLAVVPISGGGTPPEVPQFSHPTEITNPLYPVSSTAASIFLGTDGGKPARQEVTLLPTVVVIAWRGQSIEARETQSVTYVDGGLVQVRYDYFAQADNGDVYLMGEDLSMYKAGEILSRAGSWRAGEDGAVPALVMPAHPEAGQILDPDDLANMAYESQGVLSVTRNTSTPGGPVDGGVLMKAVARNGDIENRVHAANWGIVESRSADTQLNLVLLNRANATPGTVPEPLSTIEAQAEDIMDLAPGGHWEKVTADVAALNQAWQGYQSVAASDHAPQPFLAALTDAANRLQEASAAKDAKASLQAANDLSAAVVDLYTVYRPAIPADLGRLDMLERQVGFDVAANDLAAAKERVAQAGVVWARLRPFVLAHKASDIVTQFDNSLAGQQAALNAGDASALTTKANNSLELIDALEQQY